MKQILLIATGGTIASRPTENGLAPELCAEDILGCVPALASLCHIDALQLMNIDSTNMTPERWIAIADCVKDHYFRYDGFVITHGTDTMAYTASALSYLIQNSAKPIVLTGSQKSIYDQETDARRNLFDACLAAQDDTLHGVLLVFDGRVISGTRARKTHTKSMNAFSSIDYPDLALLREGKILHYIRQQKPAGLPAFYEKLDSRVFVLRLIPGMNPDVLLSLLPAFDALVIESFGVGGLPCYEQEDFLAAVHAWTREGKPIVITTQVPHEGSDIAVYQVGARAASLPGVLQAHTMTVESVVTKLMWILAQTHCLERIEQLFYTPVAHDLLRFE
ncbi:MAG: asparaginase [Clostridia bacterium]|nr:asparaginase [Clostridia bacterium]MBQ6858653.1 asparaginase [Clostridia bacterium]MBQ7051191.1 asparaginase [Clostridia bacterium]